MSSGVVFIKNITEVNSFFTFPKKNFLYFFFFFSNLFLFFFYDSNFSLKFNPSYNKIHLIFLGNNINIFFLFLQTIKSSILTIFVAFFLSSKKIEIISNLFCFFLIFIINFLIFKKKRTVFQIIRKSFFFYTIFSLFFFTIFIINLIIQYLLKKKNIIS